MGAGEEGKGLPHFIGWKNIEEGYFTKTTLRNDYRLKPKNPNQHDATLRAFTSGKWREFVLFHIDHTIEIKQRKVKLLELNEENIAESLYIINKSAKKSRDTKQENYYRGNFQVVGTSKTRQGKLYDLKNAVIHKLLSENKINIIGYHKQNSYDGSINHLILLELKGFTFHLPVEINEIRYLKCLGEIGNIPAEKTRATKINFYEAQKLLKHYIDLDD